MSNVIFLEYFNKKNFPPGEWQREPDLSAWEHADQSCLAIRDMSLGIWKGFVGVAPGHPFHSKPMDEIIKREEVMEAFFSIHGGICSAGKLLPRYKGYASNFWWLGIETSQGEDLMPLLKLDTENPDMAKMVSHQTYKNFMFIRKETNKLARFLSRIK